MQRATDGAGHHAVFVVCDCVYRDEKGRVLRALRERFGCLSSPALAA